MHTVTGSLPATPPFDFTKTLRFIGIFTPAAGEQRASATSLTKAVALDGRAVAFTAAPAGDVEHPAVTYTLHADDPLTDADRATLEERIAFYLSLDDDLRPVYAIARADSVFAPIVERLYGLHQVKFLTTYEHACYDACAVMIRRLVETLIIEAFEAHKLDSKIKGTTGEFFSLRDLIKAAQDESWNLGRISKPALGRLKSVGDMSAHMRRYNATRKDIDELIPDVRVVVQEFLALAGLR